MQHQELYWSSRDGLQLFAQLWQPETDPRAVVCLVHGLGEHSGRYDHLAAALETIDCALLGFDLRGHGRSPGRRGHTPSYDALLDDVAVLLEQAGQRFPSRSRFLYGHSLGGNLVLDYGLQRRPQLTGVIATGPALLPGFEPSPAVVFLARTMNNLWPSFTMNNQLDRKFLSRDPQVVAAYKADSLVHDRLSARLGYLILETGPRILERAAEFPLPLLLMHGSEDRIASPEATRQFAERVSGDCTCRVWEGFYHEIHNEPEQDQVFTVILDWLKARL